jgi:hypothetical protein
VAVREAAFSSDIALRLLGGHNFNSDITFLIVRGSELQSLCEDSMLLKA